jgi:peptidase M28-like protein
MMTRILLILIVAATASAQVNLETVLERVRAEVKTDEAMEHMRRVYSTDRWFTFPKFQETAEYLKRSMIAAGLNNVELLGAPADGVTQAGYWTEPLAWDAKQARLELVGPDVPDEFRVLADYEKVPTSLGMWSGPTPPGGTVAEIVDVGKTPAEEIAKMNLAGKLVLTGDNPANIKWALVKAGAFGAINTFTENPDLKDGRQWINAWGDAGWAFIKGSTPMVCFSITPRQSEFVRKLMASGRTLRARATVDSRYYAGVYPYVTGVIPGDGTDEEVLTLGHSSEQGAQDNATGVAAMLESLSTLDRLITAGKLPRPKRTIRLLLMGEMYGSMHYMSTHPDVVRRTVAAMCVDTPAAPYDLAGTEYTFYMNPHVAKSYVDAFVLHVAQLYFPQVGRPWHEHAFMTGTDTYIAEPTVGIPAVWPYSGTGVVSHHNSEDTPDKVDPRSLRDLTTVNATYLYYLANAGEREAPWLAELAANRGYEQILNAAAPFLDRAFSAQGGEELGHVLAQALDKIAYEVGRESQSVEGVLRLVPESRREAVRAQIAPLVKGLEDFGNVQSARVREAADGRAAQIGAARPVEPRAASDPQMAEAKRIVVKRKRFGTIPLDDIRPDQREGYPSGAWDATVITALYWCDGRRNLAEVIWLTRLELGGADLDFVGYFKFLRKRGYVDFVGPDK